MTEAAAVAEAAPSSAPSTDATPSTSAVTSTQQEPASSAPASSAPDLPPGWAKRDDGQWVWRGQVDGEETELDVDRAAHFLRTKESAQRRWQEASRLQQAAESRERELVEYLETLKSPQGVRELARELGLDPRQVAEAILAQEMEEASLSAEERELRELRAERERHQRETTQQQQQQREQQIQREQQAQYQRLTTGFTAAMERAGAPQNEHARQWIMARVATHYSDHMQNGSGAVHVDDLAKRALAEYREAASGAFTDDDLLERVWSNEQLREKLRGRYLEAAQPARPTRPQPVPGPGDLPPRGADGKFQAVRIDTSARPSDFSAQLDELVRRKNRGG
jgi:hypothetical protein